MRACDCRIVVSDSVRPHGLQPARLLCPWGFSRQEYWSRLPCPPTGDLPDPGIKPRSPALQADSLPTEPPEKPPSKFIWGQNEDRSWRDSTSGSSEKLLQRGRGKVSYVCVFGEVYAIKHFFFFFLQVSTSHEEQTSPCRILVLS